MLMLPPSATLLPRYVFFSHVAHYIVLYRFVHKSRKRHVLLSHDVIEILFHSWWIGLDAGVLPALLNCMVLAGGVAPPIHKGAVF